jgi:hypothetical protein
MSRLSIPSKTAHENAYAIRLRVLTPPHGLRCLEEMHVWLREKTHGKYAIDFDRAESIEFAVQEFAVLYMNDADQAAECVKKFKLVLSGKPQRSR